MMDRSYLSVLGIKATKTSWNCLIFNSSIIEQVIMMVIWTMMPTTHLNKVHPHAPPTVSPCGPFSRPQLLYWLRLLCCPLLLLCGCLARENKHSQRNDHESLLPSFFQPENKSCSRFRCYHPTCSDNLNSSEASILSRQGFIVTCLTCAAWLMWSAFSYDLRHCCLHVGEQDKGLWLNSKPNRKRDRELALTFTNVKSMR